MFYGLKGFTCQNYFDGINLCFDNFMSQERACQTGISFKLRNTLNYTENDQNPSKYAIFKCLWKTELSEKNNAFRKTDISSLLRIF